MRMSFCAGFIFLFVLVPFAKGNYLHYQLAELQTLSDEAFLEAFPYTQLLEQQEGRQVAFYKDIKQTLETHQRPVAPFFLSLVEQQLAREPIDLNNREQLNQYLELGKFLVQHQERHYNIAADVIFENLAEVIEQGFNNEKLKKTDKEIMIIVEQLKKQEYGVSIPVSNLEKGLHHLSKGNIGYIWSRLWFDHPILCILGIIGLVAALYIIIKKTIKK